MHLQGTVNSVMLLNEWTFSSFIIIGRAKWKTLKILIWLYAQIFLDKKIMDKKVNLNYLWVLGTICNISSNSSCKKEKHPPRILMLNSGLKTSSKQTLDFFDWSLQNFIGICESPQEIFNFFKKFSKVLSNSSLVFSLQCALWKRVEPFVYGIENFILILSLNFLEIIIFILIINFI